MSEPIAWLYSTSEGWWSLASRRPTPANCHLAARGVAPEKLIALPLGFDPGARSSPPRPVAYAWRNAAMKGWAIGKRPPLATDTYLVKHPELFAAYEIRPLYLLPARG